MSAKSVESQGILIALEGGEGAGKSSLSRHLLEHLPSALSKNRPLLSFREPGTTRLGQQVRKILLTGKDGTAIEARSELFLFLAARAQNMQENIIPALASGAIVLVDRFHASTIAYQSGGRGLDRGLCTKMCDFSSSGRWPDWTLFLDLDPQKGLERARSVGGHDRMEREEISFHQRVYRCYHEIFEGDERILRLDARAPYEEMLRQGLYLTKEAIEGV